MFTKTDILSIKRLYEALEVVEDQYISQEDTILYEKVCLILKTICYEDVRCCTCKHQGNCKPHNKYEQGD